MITAPGAARGAGSSRRGMRVRAVWVASLLWTRRGSLPEALVDDAATAVRPPAGRCYFTSTQAVVPWASMPRKPVLGESWPGSTSHVPRFHALTDVSGNR